MQHPEALKRSMHLAAKKMNYMRNRDIFTIILGDNLIQIGFGLKTQVNEKPAKKQKGAATNFYLPESDSLCDIVI